MKIWLSLNILVSRTFSEYKTVQLIIEFNSVLQLEMDHAAIALCYYGTHSQIPMDADQRPSFSQLGLR